jgi:hypothetical protein
MDLLYIKAKDGDHFFESEYAAVKTGLIFCDSIQVICDGFDSISLLKSLNKISDKKFIALYKKILADKESDNEPDDEDTDDFFEYLTHLRNMKQKGQEHLVELAKMEKDFNGMVDDVKDILQQFTVIETLDSVIGFVDEKVLTILDSNPEENYNTKLVEDRIIDSLINFKVINIFEDDLVGIFADESIGETSLEVENDITDTYFYFDLFCIPNLDSLTHNQLQIIRNEFLEKFQPFYKDAEAVINAMKEVSFINENEAEIKRIFGKLISPHPTFLSDTVDANIYSQQVENSIPNVEIYTFRLCCTSIKNVVRYYEELGAITTESKELILNAVARNRDINSCCFFFHIEDISEEDEDEPNT